MFFDRRQLRRWAARVLLAWLFGVGAGVANACLVASDEVEAGPTTAASAHEHTGEHAGPQHDDEGSPGKGNCVDFCEKSSVAVSGSKLPDRASMGVLPVPVCASSLPVVAPGAEHAAVAEVARRWHGPPIPIAFLRLAL